MPSKKWTTRADVYGCLLRARQAIEKAEGERLTLDQLAAIATLSPYHFQRLFRRTFGETPAEFQRRRRYEIARRLLETTDLAVGIVCGLVGAQSFGSFSRDFRRVHGLSPKHARNAQTRRNRRGVRIAH